MNSVLGYRPEKKRITPAIHCIICEATSYYGKRPGSLPGLLVFIGFFVVAQETKSSFATHQANLADTKLYCCMSQNVAPYPLPAKILFLPAIWREYIWNSRDTLQPLSGSIFLLPYMASFNTCPISSLRLWYARSSHIGASS